MDKPRVYDEEHIITMLIRMEYPAEVKDALNQIPSTTERKTVLLKAIKRSGGALGWNTRFIDNLVRYYIANFGRKVDLPRELS